MTFFLFVILTLWTDNTTPLNYGEQLIIPSPIMGEDRTIYVALPESYQTQEKAYPVLYMTDGLTHFQHTTSTVHFLADNGLIPEMIVVSVENTQRRRDLTPPPSPGRKICCGADRFIDFFEKDLIPHIEKHYRTQPFRVFTGHSYGGLFAMHIFLTRNALFNGYLSISPTMFWADSDPVKRLAQFLETKSTLSSSLVVVQGKEHPRMNPPFKQMVKLLDSQSIEGFEVRHRHMLDEDHGSVVLRATYWGLSEIFHFWPLDRETPYQNLKVLQAHYQQLSKRVGFLVQMPESQANDLGYKLFREGRVKEAIEIFMWNTDRFPHSANAYDSLAESYEKLGYLEKALSSYRKAVQVAKQNKEESGYYRRNLERVKDLKKQRK